MRENRPLSRDEVEDEAAQRARQGRRNRRAGNGWRDSCVPWLNDKGWSGAAAEIRNRHSDLVGTWDLAVECTITGWDKIWIKLDQARRDALERGLEDYCVWKKRNGRTDPGEGAVIMPAHRFFPLVMRLERLEHAELDAAEAYDRGYRNGQKAQQEAAS